MIIGNRPLELDGIGPGLFIEFPDNKTAHVFRGMEQVRAATPDEIKSLPKLSTFGFRFMREYANSNLRRKTS